MLLIADHAQAAWAHPECGGLLAVIVDTGIVTLWEEHAGSDGNVIMQLRACLDGKQSCVMAFAPQQFGLQLAVGSKDGCVRCLGLARHPAFRAPVEHHGMQGAALCAAGCGRRNQACLARSGCCSLSSRQAPLPAAPYAGEGPARVCPPCCWLAPGRVLRWGIVNLLEAFTC